MNFPNMEKTFSKSSTNSHQTINKKRYINDTSTIFQRYNIVELSLYYRYSIEEKMELGVRNGKQREEG